MRNAIKLILPFVLLQIACSEKNGPQQAASPPAAALKVISLKKQDITTYKTYATTIEGKQNVEIWPKVSGFIEGIYVEEGQQVKKGQLLFKLETQSLSQDANAAKALVNIAQVEVDKLVPLVDKGIISMVQLETAKAKLMQAQSTYESIVANINYSRITSPVDGYLGAIPYKVGTLVSFNMSEPMSVVSDISEVRAYFSLNEKELLAIRQRLAAEGKQITLENAPEVDLIMINGETYPYKGKITMVNNIINSTTGSVMIRADFKNPENLLSTGSTGAIKIPSISKDIFVIPQTATIDMQGNKMVYIVDKDNKVTGTPIKIDSQTNEAYLVRSGIAAGTTIVIEGVSKLKDGQIINPVH